MYGLGACGFASSAGVCDEVKGRNWVAGLAVWEPAVQRNSDTMGRPGPIEDHSCCLSILQASLPHSGARCDNNSFLESSRLPLVLYWKIFGFARVKGAGVLREINTRKDAPLPTSHELPLEIHLSLIFLYKYMVVQI